jgi:hypothetical protein
MKRSRHVSIIAQKHDAVRQAFPFSSMVHGSWRTLEIGDGKAAVDGSQETSGYPTWVLGIVYG